MPSRKPASPLLDTDKAEQPENPDNTDRSEALALAEAEAAEAEATAAAARARAHALRLRQQGEASASDSEDSDSDADDAEEARDDTDDTSAREDPADAEVGALDIDDPASAVAPEDTAGAESGADAAEKPTLWQRVRVPRISWRKLPWKIIAAGAVVVVILGLVGASGYMVWHHRQVERDQQRSAEFAAAARQGVVTLMSLDYNKAKENVKAIIDSTTGDFKKDFQNTSEDFIKVAQQSKAVTTVSVTAAGVESMTDDTAVVLVSATSKVTNDKGAKQEPRPWRLRVDVARDGDQLKLSKVEFVP